MANEKQFNYQMEVRQIVVDAYWLALEEYFGGKMNILAKMEAVVN